MILLTRPHEDSLALAKLLGKKNCLIEPMLVIEKIKINFNRFLIDSPQAIVVTSKNSDLPNTDIPVISIPQYGKDAQEILQYCLHNLSPQNGNVIYLSGETATIDISIALRKHGFKARRVVTYKQIAPARLSQEFQDNFSKITIATFFSEKTFLHFKKLCENKNFSNITCICMSKKIAVHAEKMGWKKVIIAASPNLANMIAATRQALLE